MHYANVHNSSLVFSSKDVVLPDRRKLKFVNKMPNFKNAKKEMKNLKDIQGPATTANAFTKGEFAIVVSGFNVKRLLISAAA